MRNYRMELEQKKGRLQQLREDLRKAKSESEDLHLQSIYCEEAATIIQTVAQQTQKELEYHVSEIVSLAMNAVFEDPYTLLVEFVQRRNRTECDLSFQRRKKSIHPMNSSGGAIDVAAFALRVALWSLAPVRSRPVLILDEPLKWLKGGELPERGADMMKEISSRVGLQIICISHVPDQITGADKRIQITIRKGKSEVTYGRD